MKNIPWKTQDEEFFWFEEPISKADALDRFKKVASDPDMSTSDSMYFTFIKLFNEDIPADAIVCGLEKVTMKLILYDETSL
jgi:hypothetical protein